MDSQLWHCTDCGDERAFVQPACIDGHTEDGGECPEWACTDCGSAVVVGEPVVLTRVVRARIAA